MHSSPFCAYSVPIASLRPPAPILGRLSALVSQKTVFLSPGTALQGADTRTDVLPKIDTVAQLSEMLSGRSQLGKTRYSRFGAR
jgi:hypothetical protein